MTRPPESGPMRWSRIAAISGYSPDCGSAPAAAEDRPLRPGAAHAAEGDEAAGRCPVAGDAGRWPRWLRQILVRTMADEARRYSRGKRDAGLERSILAELDESSARLEPWLAGDQSTPSQQAIRHRAAPGAGRGPRGAARGSAQAVELHHLNGCSVAEVGARLGRSYASVAGLLRRGIKALREK